MTKTLSAKPGAKHGEIKALRSTSLCAGQVPERVLLAPWGEVESTNGSFVVDEESAELALAAFAGHGTDLPIDYEHQTLGGEYASPTGQAPAAGWIKRMHVEPGVGLLADIEWTPQAKELLASRQYRYLSPVAVVRKADRKLIAIHSAALTNKPAIVGMEPIVNSRPRGTCVAPAVDADEREDDGLCHEAAPIERLRRQLRLPEETGAEEVLIAAGKTLLEARKALRRRHVEERIRQAVQAGKLVEAQRAWAEELVAREEQLFDEWFRTAPVIVRPGTRIAADADERFDAVDSSPGTIVPEYGTNGSRPGSATMPHSRRFAGLEARARAEFRAHRILSALTTEEAFVADALRCADRERN